MECHEEKHGRYSLYCPRGANQYPYFLVYRGPDNLGWVSRVASPGACAEVILECGLDGIESFVWLIKEQALNQSLMEESLWGRDDLEYSYYGERDD